MTRTPTPKRPTAATEMDPPPISGGASVGADLAAYLEAKAAATPAGVLYLVALRPVAIGDVPACVRLRHALKRLLRSYGLRAIAVREVRPGAADAPAARGTPGTGTVARAEPRPREEQSRD